MSLQFDPEVIEYLVKLGWSSDQLHTATYHSTIQHEVHTRLCVERPVKGWARDDRRMFVLRYSESHFSGDPVIPRRVFSCAKRGWRTSVMLWYQRAVFDLATIKSNAEQREAKQDAAERVRDEACRRKLGVCYEAARNLAYLTFNEAGDELVDVAPQRVISIKSFLGSQQEKVDRIRKLGQFLAQEGFIENRDAP
jgi:hypothetical protein